jgi:hypothetical protein
LDNTQIQQDETISANRELALNHACTIAAAARSGMKNGVTIRLMSVKLINKEEFLFLPKRTLFGTRCHKSDTPDKWFRYSYNKRRLCNIKLLIPDGIYSENDENSMKYPLVCFHENKSVTEFVPDWKYDSETAKWSVTYIERKCGSPEPAKARYSDNSDELRAALDKMSEIADKLGFDNYRAEFQNGIFALDERFVDWDDDVREGSGHIPLIRRPVLSKRFAALFAAASRTPHVKLGDWYGEMSEKAQSIGMADSLEEASEELTKQQRLAMLFAVNES